MTLCRSLSLVAAGMVVVGGGGPVRAQLLSGPGPSGGSGSTSSRGVAPQVKRTGPLNIQEKVAIAERLMRQGTWDRAVVAIEDILKTEPKMTGAALSLSTCYIKLERFDDAFKLLAPILVENPEHPFVLNNTAWVRLQSTSADVHNPAIAVELARRAVLGAPNRANIWGTLAEGYLALSVPDAEKAIVAAKIGRSLSVLDTNSDMLEFDDLVQRAERRGGVVAPKALSPSSGTE